MHSDDNDVRDYVEYYGIEQAKGIGESVVKRVMNPESGIHLVSICMHESSKHGDLSICRTRNPKNIFFGRFGNPDAGNPETYGMGTISPKSSSLLTLNRGERPLVALRYGLYLNPQELVIGYVQSDARLDTFESFQELRKELGGVRPHELLVAEFLARSSAALNAFPNIGVFVAPHYLSKPLYPKLRDRFFDDNYALNPNRERVIQILGEDNAWLSNEAVSSRKARLEEILRRRSGRIRLRDLFVRSGDKNNVVDELGGDIKFDIPGMEWPQVYI